VAKAGIAQNNQRHQYGDTACCGLRCVMGSDQRGFARSGFEGKTARYGEAPALSPQ
jgi:hypothetical protein